MHLTAPAGDNYYAEVHNIDNGYAPGYFGDSGYSFFGFANQPPYAGDFSQSIKMYVKAGWPVALYGGPGVWIDEAPGSPSGNYGGSIISASLPPEVQSASLWTAKPPPSPQSLLQAGTTSR